MGEVRVETPQNVPIEYAVASLADRIIARVFDFIILFGYSILISLLLGWGGGFNAFPLWVQVIFYLPIFFYDVIFETALNGQTFGKRVMHIRVIKLDGSQASVGSFLMRWLFFIVEGQITAGTLAILAVAANGRGQRLGDLAAGTAVIKLPQKEKIRGTIMRNISEDYSPMFPQVALLTDADMAIIDRAFRKGVRRRDSQLLKYINRRILPLLQIAPDDERLQAFNARTFLKRIVRDYNYYSGRAEVDSPPK